VRGLPNKVASTSCCWTTTRRAGRCGQVIQGLRGTPHPGDHVLSSRPACHVHRPLTARGFTYKPDAPGDAVIGTRRNGDLFLSPKASALPYKERLLRNPDDLQHRDVEILRLMAQGYTVQEIAAHLDLASRSVYRLRGRLRAALNVRTNEQLVDAARERGLLDNGPASL
jgi:DNA-binding CsgD family transcriptional regulator